MALRAFDQKSVSENRSNSYDSYPLTLSTPDSPNVGSSDASSLSAGRYFPYTPVHKNSKIESLQLQCKFNFISTNQFEKLSKQTFSKSSPLYLFRSLSKVSSNLSSFPSLLAQQYQPQVQSVYEEVLNALDRNDMEAAQARHIQNVAHDSRTHIDRVVPSLVTSCERKPADAEHPDILLGVGIGGSTIEAS